MRIDFHSAAIADIEESRDWYAQHSLIAVRGFELALSDALSRISFDPQSFSTVDARHRTCSLFRYPFQLIFESTTDRILVIAVAHAKRMPGYWSERGEN